MGKGGGDRIYLPGQNRRWRETRGMIEEVVTQMEMVMMVGKEKNEKDGAEEIA